MATNLRLPMRNRTGPQRPRNADENAMGRHVRQASGIALAGVSRVLAGPTMKNGVQRPVLTEVTTTAVNRTGKRWIRHCSIASRPLVRHQRDRRPALHTGWLKTRTSGATSCRAAVSTVRVIAMLPLSSFWHTLLRSVCRAASWT
ncbi:hypothetical protein BD414DRAFT_5082 [Trametes punicea]|nr:hypothetical protein BD414DRAFT_5082 [Trametes punicea]